MSKQAEELILEILATAYPSMVMPLYKSDKLKAAALIDAELRKERERIGEWFCTHCVYGKRDLRRPDCKRCHDYAAILKDPNDV